MSQILLQFAQQNIKIQTASMRREDDEQKPALLTIPKKATINSLSETPKVSNDALSIFPKDSHLQSEIKKTEGRSSNAQNKNEFDKTFKNINEQGKSEVNAKRRKNDRQKQLQKSKNLIDEMRRRLTAKSITQKLYPVTNETIDALILKLDRQIESLRQQIDKRKSSLNTNPSDTFLKRQLQTLHSNMDRCVTLKQLYCEKTDLRNKISLLENNILTLKSENSELKIRIQRGIDAIEKHMKELPKQNVQEMKEELSHCRTELKKEKEMRENLERTIANIVKNFKRFYEEADTARMIITEKLREIQDKEKHLASKIAESELDQSQRKSALQLEHSEDRRLRKTIHNADALDGSKTNKKPLTYKQYPRNDQIRQTTTPDKRTVGAFSLEEQIRKMRANQLNLSTNVAAKARR